MIKKFIKGLDQKYLKICIYSAFTVLITVIVGALVFSTGPSWSRLWAITTAVLKPIIIGGIICYLLLPVVNWFEKLFNRNKKHGWARTASVVLTFAIIAAVIIIVLGMIIVSIYKNLGSLNIDSLCVFKSGVPVPKLNSEFILFGSKFILFDSSVPKFIFFF